MVISLNPKIGTSTSKTKSPVTPGRSSGQNVYDKMAALFQEVRAKHMEGSSNGDDILGYCLYCHLLTVEQFKAQYKNNEPFIKEVVKSASKKDTAPSSYIMEVYVNVPEITGLLPEPKLEYIFGLLKARNEIVTDKPKYRATTQDMKDMNAIIAGIAKSPELQGADSELDNPALKQRIHQTVITALMSESQRAAANPTQSSEVLEELAVIAMYPRFYKYTETGEVIPPGAICKVKYSGSLTSKFAGICIDQIDNNYQDIAPNPLQDLIEGLKSI